MLAGAVDADGYVAEVTDPDTVNVLHNRIKARLMLRGVDADTIDAASGDPTDLLRLIRTNVLWGDELPITIGEVANRAGLDIELCRRARMLLGLPDPGDEAHCRPEEVDAFAALAAGIAVFGEEPVLQFTRVIGSSLGSIGEGALSVFARAMASDDGGAVGTDQAVGSRNDDAYVLAAFDALEAFRSVPEVLKIVTTLQFDLATDRLTGNPGDRQVAAVGFVDLVSSTRRTEEIGIQRMARAVSGWEETAVALASSMDGRVVKFIGDEVMFVAPDLAAAASVALGLVRAAADDPDLGSARAGVAHGPMVSRDGDWFGTVVNTAARLAEKAPAGTVLLTGEGAELVEGTVTKGRRRLRGLPERVPVSRLSI